ncbi:hypothetical protein [Flavisolibacter ginsengisoli]|uniref:Killing trait domain-containing protein n=1 Tax=Flavisolibacter ginsengisoli DSM 18119 TaxID=1121884 RepID=A0A1M4ZM53_9BACT|nr:hypothetical protein [Flavisolibacter ginsengisoli]SHF19123.1 hypothetical protein SAMN02745131_01997 [Flavisolibacter ginsengisoli DSM 18119]
MAANNYLSSVNNNQPQDISQTIVTQTTATSQSYVALAEILLLAFRY